MAEMRSFGEFATFKYGKMPDKKKLSKTGEYPVYSGYRYVGYYDEYNTEANQIIVVARGVGGTGDVKLTKERCYLTNLSISAEIDESIALPEFIYYYFMPRNLRYLDSGSAQSQITISDLEKVMIPLPSLNEQRAICGYLKMLDRKIKINEDLNNNLLQQVSMVFKHWFTDNPNLNTMNMVSLADLCMVVTKGTTPTTLGKPFVSEGINFIKAESILDNHAFDKDKFAFIDSETNDLLRRSILSSGDILFTIAGTLGRFALIDESVLPANTNQAVAIIRANRSKVKPEYLYSFFLGNWHNDYYSKRIQQAVQANLSLGTIKSLPIPILTDKEMKEYLRVISPIIKLSKANELEVTRLKTIRDALLPKLMSGEIDVSGIDI